MAKLIMTADDSASVRQMVSFTLKQAGYDVVEAVDGKDALTKLGTQKVDMLITDLNMPVMDGRQLLEELQRSGSSPSAIVLTAFGSVEMAVETVHQLGAFWYLEKPVRPKELRAILERAIAHRRLAERSERLERELSSQGVLGGMVARSQAMRGVFALLQQAAPTKATILVTGETGTGKEVAARAIHDISRQLGVAAVAEMVDDAAVFAMVREIGIELGQGAWFEPPRLFEDWLAVCEARHVNGESGVYAILPSPAT